MICPGRFGVTVSAVSQRSQDVALGDRVWVMLVLGWDWVTPEGSSSPDDPGFRFGRAEVSGVPSTRLKEWGKPGINLFLQPVVPSKCVILNTSPSSIFMENI